MHRVFVDSNVLGSKTLYDWVFLLREHSGAMFALSTSEDVLDEAHRVWRKRHPNLGGEFREHRDRIFRKSFDDICGDWDGGTAPILDIHDSHVHNAAVHMNVDILLTSNIADFGDPDLLPYDIYTPDEFFSLIAKNSFDAVREVTDFQAKHYMKIRERFPERETKTLADALRDAGCFEFAKVVSKCLEFQSGPIPVAVAI